MLITGKDSADAKTFVSVRGQAARLVRVTGEDDGNPWYTLKEAKSDVPFFFGSASQTGMLELPGPTPWSQRDPLEIRSAIR